MTYRPYRKFYLSKLKEIAHEHWDSLHELEKILSELAERKDLDRILPFYTEVAERIESLKEKQHEENQIEEQKRQEDAKRQREQEKKDGWFSWPSTNAPMGEGGMNAHWYADGLFSYVGYHVGNNGEVQETREKILDCIFHNELPNVASDEYMQEFNDPKTPKRLKKMADFLSSEARNFKRNKTADYSQAIADYESDLAYLYREYYEGVFNFGWPNT